MADNLFALPPEVILWCLMLAQPLNNIGPSRLWDPLFGIVSHLKSALFHGICPARFTSCLKLLYSPGPGLGVETDRISFSFSAPKLQIFQFRTSFVFGIFVLRSVSFSAQFRFRSIIIFGAVRN